MLFNHYYYAPQPVPAVLGQRQGFQAVYRKGHTRDQQPTTLTLELPDNLDSPLNARAHDSGLWEEAGLPGEAPATSWVNKSNQVEGRKSIRR